MFHSQNGNHSEKAKEEQMNLLTFPVVSEYTVLVSIYQSLEKEVSSIQYAGHIRAIYLKDTFLS